MIFVRSFIDSQALKEAQRAPKRRKHGVGEATIAKDEKLGECRSFYHRSALSILAQLNVSVVKRRGDIPANVDPTSGTYDWYEMTRPAPGGKAKQQPQLFTLPIHQWAQAPMRNEFRIVSTGMKVRV